MKQLTIIALLALILAGCAGMSASTGLTEEEEAAIPDDAKAVVLTTSMKADELYQATKEVLEAEGFEFSQENPNLRRMITENKGVGRRMEMHVVVRILPATDATKVELTGKWAFEQTSNAMESTLGGTQRVQEATRDAAWISNGSSRYAYAQLVLLGRKIAEGEITYQ